MLTLDTKTPATKIKKTLTSQSIFTIYPMKINLDFSKNINTLKWIGLILMTLDHINKYIPSISNAIIFDAGRLVMPLFAFILAYNLNRNDSESNQKNRHYRTIRRLFFFGIVATPAYICGDINHNPFVLNILFLLLGCSILDLILKDKKNLSKLQFYSWLLTTLFLTSLLCEFWLFGVLVFLSSRQFILKTNLASFLWWTITILGLSLVNQNNFALIAIPLILCCSFFKFIPWLENFGTQKNHRLFFYAYYPAHLSVIVAIAYFLPIK